MSLCRFFAVAVFVSVLAASAPAAKLSTRTVKGVYAFSLTASGSLVGSNQTPVAQTINRLGVIDADGKGGLSGHSISVLDDGTNITIIDYKWTGTYTIQPDGTGTMTINAPAPSDINDCRSGAGDTVGGCSALVGQEKFAFVMISGSKTDSLGLIQTDGPVGSPRLLLRGAANSQIIKGGGGNGGGGFGLF